MMETERGETDARLGARSRRAGHVGALGMGLINAGRMPGLF
jgi:hypothetical protein